MPLLVGGGAYSIIVWHFYNSGMQKLVGIGRKSPPKNPKYFSIIFCAAIFFGPKYQFGLYSV